MAVAGSYRTACMMTAGLLELAASSNPSIAVMIPGLTHPHSCYSTAAHYLPATLNQIPKQPLPSGMLLCGRPHTQHARSPQA